jgi:phage shock protein A
MRFFARISDIISANLVELTSQFGDSEALLKQLIREIDEAIADVMQQTAKAIAGERMLCCELEHNQAQGKQWEQRAIEAIRNGEDLLARRALARKNEHLRLADALKDQLEIAVEVSAALRRQLAGMQAKMAEARWIMSSIVARQPSADASGRTVGQTVATVAGGNGHGSVKFDRNPRGEELASGRIQAGRAAQDVPEVPADESDVAAELAELKRKLNVQSLQPEAQSPAQH